MADCAAGIGQCASLKVRKRSEVEISRVKCSEVEISTEKCSEVEISRGKEKSA